MTDHDTPGGVINEKKWQKLQDLAQRFYEPQKFVTFIGYEWTASNDLYDLAEYFSSGTIRKKLLKQFGKYLIKCKAFGHKSIYFPSDKVPGRIFSHLDQEADTLEKLWDALKPWKAITVPHHTLGGPTRVSYWKFRNDEMEPFVEIYSYHGNSESMRAPLPIWRPYSEENSVRYALNKGYRLGIGAGSDSHTGKGGDIRGFQRGINFLRSFFRGIKNPGGGLTAVYAKELTREAIWDAFLKRRMYGTTGARIALEFSMDEHFMGEEFSSNEPPHFKFKILSQSPLKIINIIKNGKINFSLKCHDLKCKGEFIDKKIDSGLNYYYLRVIRQDTEMAWSSPIWINYS